MPGSRTTPSSARAPSPFPRFSHSPSRCAVADSCAISVDRRLTFGEDKDLAISQIENLPSVKAAGDKAKVSMHLRSPLVDRPRLPHRLLLPHVGPARRPCGDEIHRRDLPQPVRTRTPTTSGPSPPAAFHHGPPGILVGLAPARKREAHAPDEKTWKQDLIECAALRSLASNLRRQLQLNGNSPAGLLPPVKVLGR